MTEREMAARTGPMTLPQFADRGVGRHRAPAARSPLAIPALLILAALNFVLAVAALGIVT